MFRRQKPEMRSLRGLLQNSYLLILLTFSIMRWNCARVVKAGCLLEGIDKSAKTATAMAVVTETNTSRTMWTKYISARYAVARKSTTMHWQRGQRLSQNIAVSDDL